jgi:hypothetical protein
MMAGGFHSFGAGGFRSTPLVDVLPIRMGPAERQNFGEPIRPDMHTSGQVRLQPTRAGSEHWILDLGRGTNNLDTWAKLPPLAGANRFERQSIKRGTARVLAETDGPERLPLLVTGDWGSGRVLAFAGDSTWRWRTYGFEEELKRFWRQVVLWLAKKDQATEGEVWIELAQRRISPGDEVRFTVGARSPEGQSVDEAHFTAELQFADEEPTPLEISRRGGAWVGAAGPLRTPGDFTIRASARTEQQSLGTAQARFLVLDQDIELDNPVADPDLLENLARMTAEVGGRSLPPEGLPELIDELAGRSAELEEKFVRKLTLWDNWPVLLLFVGVVGTEWFLRKKWGLV